MMKIKKILCAAAVTLMTLSASADIVYDSIPDPDPSGMPSLGYQATSTDEFGDHIAFTPGTAGRILDTVRVGLVSWAMSTDPFNDPNLVSDAGGWEQELTFNIYGVDNSGSEPDVGALLATLTDTFYIPWAPSSTVHPFAPVVFDFSSLGLALPDEIIFGLAFNTQSYGTDPTGYVGPYNSLNFGVNSLAPTVGTDVEEDALFWDTSHAPFYSDGGAAGVDTFRRDTAWTPYTPAVEFSVVPVPGAAGLGMLGMGLVGYLRRRKAA